MQRQRRGWLALGLGLMLVLAACGGDDAETTGGGGSQGGTEPESTTIRVAHSEVELDSLTTGKWIQNLEEAGITVQSVEMSSNRDVIRALAANEADMANEIPLPMMQYIQRQEGADPGVRIVAAETLKPDYVLLATPDIDSATDLEGRTVGISEPGDPSSELSRLVIQEEGADISTIDFVSIGGTSERVAALIADQVQAGAAHLADALAAEQEAGLKLLVNFWDHIDPYAFHFLMFDSEWMEANPNLAQLVVDALIDAARWAADEEEEWIELSKEFEPDLPDDIRSQVYSTFRDDGFFSVNGGIDTVEQTIEFDRAQGNLTGDVPDSSVWLDASFVEDYLKRNGER